MQFISIQDTPRDTPRDKGVTILQSTPRQGSRITRERIDAKHPSCFRVADCVQESAAAASVVEIVVRRSPDRVSVFPPRVSQESHHWISAWSETRFSPSKE